MTGRKYRLTEVYDYVRKFKGVHTQTDFAVAVNYTRSVVSAALNGNEKYLTDKLFENICKAFPDTFSLDYLLTGQGTLLAQEVEQPDQPTEPMPVWADAMIDIMAKQIKENETLHRELRQSITEFNAARADLEKIIYRLKSSSSEGSLAAES